MSRARARGRLTGRSPGATRTVALTAHVTLWLSLGLSGTAHTDQDTSDAAPIISRYLDAYRDARGLDGVVLAAVGDRVITHRAFGSADLEWEIPNRPDTRFLVASVTKPFTAMATLILAERGDVVLDAPIADYLSPYRSDVASVVTVHDLLAHTSGIPNFATREFYAGEAAKQDYERWEFIEAHCSGDLLFTPGSDTHYSDANYVLLATILERVTGETFGEILERLIFAPAGMLESTVMSSSDIHAGLASSYVTDAARPRRPRFINYAHVQRGAGDLITTATDLHRWVRALRRGDLLSEASVARMFHGHAGSAFEGMMQGYGWNLGTLDVPGHENGVSFAQAPGNNGGYNAVVYLLPEIDGLVAVLLNVGTPWLDGRLFEIAGALAGILAGGDPPLPRPSVVSLVRDAIPSSTPEDVGGLYHALVRSNRFDPDESGMNRLGYSLLRSRQVEHAVEVFELVAETTPGSSNAHDSLGEGYWNAGRLGDALASYQRSVAIDPDNANGHRMIQLIETKLRESDGSP